MSEQKWYALNNQQYDLLKNVVELVLPAAGALYFSLAVIWDFPNGENVVGSIAALNVFLGVCLGVSSKLYRESEARFDGDLVVTPQGDEEFPFLLVELNPESRDLLGKDEVIFKVRREK
jgi:imidazoleglycerol phosphate synthase glutamine amidotransferase subunit HisH